MPPSYKNVLGKHANSHLAQFHVIDAHRSSLQTRLLATLDTLDDLQRSHELELEELHQQARILRARCRIFKERAKIAEAERDELREGVNKLVEKVEIANDHRVLPLSRIHVQYPLEPILVKPPQPIVEADEIQKDAYLSSIFSALKNELVIEKRALAQLRRTSDARIAILEAQVARRDAELQAYQPCVCYSRIPSEPAAVSSHKPSLQRPEIPLSRDEAQRVLEETAARQRSLEIEVDGLCHKLQSERRLLPPHPQKIHSASHAAPSPDAVSADPSSIVPSSAHVPLDHKLHPVLSSIDRQLARLGAEVGELQTEHDNIVVTVNAQSEKDVHKDNEKFKGILLIEDECIRLRQSERSLRQQLLLAKASASAMEQELKSLVSRLQGELHSLRNPGIDGSRGEAHPDEGSLANVGSTGVNTPSLDPPLSPHVIHKPALPAPPSSSPTNPIINNDGSDASDVPPPTPPPPATTAPAEHAPTGHAAARLRRVQSELDEARCDVAERDGAIGALRTQLAALEASLRDRLRLSAEDPGKGLRPGHSGGDGT